MVQAPSATPTLSGTPGADRATYPDLLRTSAIAVVVLGHWIVTGVKYKGGHFTGVDVLGAVRWTSWLTLIFQVVPVFFFVGGYVNALSWTRYSGDASLRRWPGWVRRRIMRLLVPTSGYVVVIAIAVAICGVAGVNRGDLSQAAWAAALHLWFLAAYAVVLLMTPLLYAAHRRFGISAFFALVVVSVVIDVGHIEGHWRLVGWANYALVWGAFHQLGFAWYEGIFAGHARRVVALGVVALVTLVLLIWPGPYPVSMVGVPGARIENASPPSAALLAFGVVQAAAVLLAEPFVTRWFARPAQLRFRLAVRNAAGWSMPVYLWHMAPVVIVTLIGYPLHVFAQPAIGSGSWWLERIEWVALLVGVLVVVLALVRVGALLVGRFLPKPPEADHRPRRWSVVSRVLLVVGIGSAAAGLGRLAVEGFAPSGRLDAISLVEFVIGFALVSGYVPSKPEKPLRDRHNG